MNIDNLKNAVILLIVMAFFVSCKKEIVQSDPLSYNGLFPDESAKEVELIISDSGKISFTLYAPLMNKYLGDNEYMDFPEGIIVTSYSNGVKQSVLTADYAISEERIQNMQASKNVVITDLIKKESIKTERITWDKKRQRIFSDVEVIQIRADGTVNRGDGFEADEKFSKYSIKNPRGEMLVSDL